MEIGSGFGGRLRLRAWGSRVGVGARGRASRWAPGRRSGAAVAGDVARVLGAGALRGSAAVQAAVRASSSPAARAQRGRPPDEPWRNPSSTPTFFTACPPNRPGRPRSGRPAGRSGSSQARSATSSAVRQARASWASPGLGHAARPARTTRRAAPGPGVSGQVGADVGDQLGSQPDGDAQLLGELAVQRVLGRLAGLHLAARQLPAPGQRRRPGAAGGQHAGGAVEAVDEHRADDEHGVWAPRHGSGRNRTGRAGVAASAGGRVNRLRLAGRSS